MTKFTYAFRDRYMTENGMGAALPIYTYKTRAEAEAKLINEPNLIEGIVIETSMLRDWKRNHRGTKTLIAYLTERGLWA